VSAAQVPGFDDLPPENPDDADAWATVLPLPSAFAIAEAARELEAHGNPQDTPEQRAAQAFDLASLRAEREASAGGPSLLEQLGALTATVRPSPFPEPEDRGDAVPSPLGGVEYVEDLDRPGRIRVHAGEEGSGKSYSLAELAIRVAVAGGSWAGAWPVLATGPVLVLSEMHSDDDYDREARILGALGLERDVLRGRLYRLPLMTAAGGPPALTVPEWRSWVTGWMRERGVLLLIVDTGTGATQVDPWGQAIQGVYRDLRAMLEAYPELAIVLALHLKKPAGRGDRRLSDVLGEWGRWCDVVTLQEADGTTRTKLATHKRVRRQRRIVATRAEGLLVDPVDMDQAKSTKVPEADLIGAVAARPGMTLAELGEVLGVSKDTAARYVRAAEESGRLVTVAGLGRSGRAASRRVYAPDAAEKPEPIAASPHFAAGAERGDPAATTVEAGPVIAASPHAPYRGAAVLRAAIPAGPPCFGNPDLYRSHQHEHYRVGEGWACGACGAPA
jgi:hypothetical protein